MNIMLFSIKGNLLLIKYAKQSSIEKTTEHAGNNIPPILTPTLYPKL